MQMQSTKISGLALDTEYSFHLVLRTTAGTYASDKVAVRTHKMTDLSGITITTGILPGVTREKLSDAVERIGARLIDTVRIDTSHFITTEGRGQAWEKAVENNIPVVRPEWLDACEKNGRILGVAKFYLDAMRPTPTEEEIAPSPIPKDLPTPATENGQRAEPASAVQESADKGKKEAPNDEDNDDEDDEDDDEDVGEPEQKASSAQQEEQKVRLEDKENQKVAFRPAASEPAAAEKEDDEDEEDEGEEDEGSKEKPARTPDGSSFQDVEL